MGRGLIKGVDGADIDLEIRVIMGMRQSVDERRVEE